MKFPRQSISTKTAFASIAALALAASACGSDNATSDDASAAASADAPTVVVTTNILGDVVENLAGDQLNVITIMPVGADPHDFSPSAQDVAAIGDAAALIVNGEAFEEGLLDVIEGAEEDGVPVYEAIAAVSTIEFGEGGHDDHGDEHGDEEEHSDEEEHDDHDDEEEHSDEEEHDDHDDEEEHSDEEEHDDHDDEEEHSDEEHDDHDDHGHDHSGEDPHFFTDPARMATAVTGIAEFLAANVEGVDAAALEESATAYAAELTELDAEVAELVEGIPEDQRVLITNHEVFGYFADRYDFEVAGTVIPSGSTADATSAEQLAELADLLRDEGVPAIFSDVSASDSLTQTLADEVGDVAVVELFTESLGDEGSDGETYIDMVRTNAERIAEALAS